MPRLVGKKSNTGLYALVGVLVAAIGAVALEYFGVVDVVPGFGQATTTQNTAQPIATPRPVN
jgi:hypothetical protein